MRLIDADDLAAKIMIDAPGYLDGGSSITKAFILAMVKTRNATPTVDAVPVVRCKDCKKCDLPEEEPYENGYCSRCGYVKMDWFCADGVKKDA